ncbi:MAG: ATP-binding protein [Eubacterium sp.]|nr:ATP-binding protein [Eubacterium sp.]
MQQITRQDYLNWLIRWQGRQIIKVISGVRRCGKSTLFAQYQKYLIDNNVGKDQIIFINFEDLSYEALTDYKALYLYLKDRLAENKMNYIFLDEVQHVKQFEKAVDALYVQENCDIYITGSNAALLSGELATLLSGRYVELKMLPLSFKEYHSAFPEETLQASFNRYISQGSFPYPVKYSLDAAEVREYLQDIYNSILLKDVVARNHITDIANLERIVQFLMHNVGNRVSAVKIANTLKSQGKGIDPKTVDKYIRGLTDSLMFYPARSYNIKGKAYLTNQPKYYAVDLGIRQMLTAGRDSNIGYILENVIYLELRRRYPQVFVGSLDNGEVDFVAIDKNERLSYYQVAATTLDDNTLKRELAPFKQIEDNYPKYLITLDTFFANADYQGILKVNAVDWLLGEA